MAEREKLLNAAIEIGRKLINILDDILVTGDWDSSLFLKTSAAKLRDLRNEIAILCDIDKAKPTDVYQSTVPNKDSRQNSPPGYFRVFILLYQVDGSNLQSWYRTIKTLSEYSVTRPAYKDENHAQEFIRAKTLGIERNGYVVVNVKDNDFYPTEQHVDSFGHPLIALKEEAVKLDNVVEFVHANKKHYVIRDNALVLLGEI
ncbi:MAG: type IVB secretion system protein IcmQ [Coxiellaceae bacterium]|jgi:hypothetical protein|nr:type IVB secretion system protein IcmQ [Coxiellaceae bacterium]